MVPLSTEDAADKATNRKAERIVLLLSVNGYRRAEKMLGLKLSVQGVIIRAMMALWKQLKEKVRFLENDSSTGPVRTFWERAQSKWLWLTIVLSRK